MKPAQQTQPPKPPMAPQLRLVEEEAEAPRSIPQVSGPARICLLSLGVLFAATGVLGAFLPVLPTTPFMLLAAACFARTSPALHQRILANKMFGSYVAQWQCDRTVPRAAKRKALGLVLVTFLLSIALVDGVGLRVMLASIGVALGCFLVWLPTTAEDSELSITRE
ncbi:MAG: uncharacterized membrane protein YbaN (DUF454 family) [Planctomycetota bacterium]|jgi:uncharacterized membrane protein YbaN (DUF454 family)